MAKESSKKREAIFAAFESIPETFAMAAEKRKIFHEYGHLKEKVASLHGTIVSSIMVLISFLLPDRRGEYHYIISVRPRRPDVVFSLSFFLSFFLLFFLSFFSAVSFPCQADRGYYGSSSSLSIH